MTTPSAPPSRARYFSYTEMSLQRTARILDDEGDPRILRNMTGDTPKRLSKQERREERRRLARQRVLATRARRVGVVAALLAIPGLWALEHSGPQELVEAEVVETRRWRHYVDGRDPHPHLAATLQIEGLSEATLDQADGYERGQRIMVFIRRGRISGWPYFMDVVEP